MSKAFLKPQIVLLDQKGPERVRNRVRLLPDIASKCFFSCMGKRIAGTQAGWQGRSQPCTGRSRAVSNYRSCR